LEKVIAELERLQEAVWALTAQKDELQQALEAALPLLLHAEHRPDHDCRRCRALEAARSALHARLNTL
jgi:hypothetical protein